MSFLKQDGSLNESRYDNKKAEEKRKWLQELGEFFFLFSLKLSLSKKLEI